MRSLALDVCLFLLDGLADRAEVYRQQLIREFVCSSDEGDCHQFVWEMLAELRK